jgi:tetratricopeptide (TPR) repeat protein
MKDSVMKWHSPITSLAVFTFCSLTASAIDDPAYAKALSFLQTNEADQALALIEAELKTTSASDRYLELKGRVFHSQGKYQEAREQYEEALKANPKRFTAYFHIGETYFRQGNWSDAFTHYRIHAESDPPAVDSRLKMIYCLSAVENFAAALKLCSTLDPVDTYSPAYYFGRACLDHFRGNIEEYNTALRQVRTIYGTESYNHYMPDLLHLIKSTRSGDEEKKES